MIVIVVDTWLFLIGLGKLPMSFQRQFRKNLSKIIGEGPIKKPNY